MTINGITNLIRIHKWQLDEKRRAIGDMEHMLAGFKDQLAKLDREQEMELRVAGQNEETRFAYTNYAKAAKIRRENLIASITEAEQRIAEAQEEVAEIYQDLKKYEISEETRIRLLKEQQKKRLQQEMDAVSLDMYRRKSHQ
ncbi:MAG: flagellar export protein FliJ [Sneathiella sp.]